MDETTRDAIKGLLGRYAIGEIGTADARGMAVLDRTGEVAVLTMVCVPPDGQVRFGRHNFPAGLPGKTIQEVVDSVDWPEDEADAGIGFSEALNYLGLNGRPAAFADGFVSEFRLRYAEVPVEGGFLSDFARAALAAGGSAKVAASLNAEALHSLRSVSRFGRGAYAFYSAEGERGVSRRQAAAAYPLLAGEMSSKILLKSSIDRRKPLAEALEGAFGTDELGNPKVTRGMLKRLHGMDWGDGGVPVASIVEALSKLPPDWFPKNAEEWGAFLDIADTAFRHLAPAIGEKIESLSAGCSGKWVDFRQRIAKSFASTFPPDDLSEEEKAAWRPVVDVSREALSSACVAARDVVNAFRSLVVLPASASTGGGAPVFVGHEQRSLATDAAARIIYGGKSLPAIMELQRHWHTQAHNILEATAGDEPEKLDFKTVADDGWAPMCNMINAPNGLTLVPLTDPRELRAEGAGGLDKPGPDVNGVMGLGHCVGGHSETCRRGHHIISVRRYDDNGGFVRLSTIEYGRIPAVGNQLQEIQHRGIRNGPAPTEAVAARDWFVARVAAGEIPLNRDGVMVYLSNARSKEDVEQYCGYDWRDPEKVEKAFAPWAPYLPKRLRGIDLAGLCRSPELAELNESLVPAYHGLRR